MDINTTINNIIENIASGAIPLLGAVSCVMGFLILGIGVVRLTKHGKTQQHFRYYAPSTTALMIFAGVVLVSISGFYTMLSNTLFDGYNAMAKFNSLTAYVQSLKTSGDEPSIKSLAFALVIIVGFFSLVRGVYLLMKISEGQEGHLSRALSHLVAGAFGMNIVTLFSVLQWVHTAYV